MNEKEKMLAGELYDANYNDDLIKERYWVKNKCYDYNQLKPSNHKGKENIIKEIFGKTGNVFTIEQPFMCDYGYNIEIGENFYANHNLIILDGNKVEFGDNVFIAPNCSFYTAGHPLDVERRNKGLEYAKPIKVGNNVWIGGNVVVLPGVTIGNPQIFFGENATGSISLIGLMFGCGPFKMTVIDEAHVISYSGAMSIFGLFAFLLF